MDIVFPYKKSHSQEMIYAVRSLKNIPHDKVHIIGDKTIFKVHHIPYNQGSNVALNTLNIVDIAVESEDISESFIWMADDMYILKPIDAIPTRHRGPYSEILEGYKDVEANFYVDRMRKTHKVLQKLGIEEPICYELHIPFVIKKTQWKLARPYMTHELNKLSIYGNLNKIGGSFMNDVKVRKKDWMPDGDFVSTHDTTFGLNSAGARVRGKFSKRCEYEP